MLRKLAAVPGNMVIVISPRSAETLENVLGNLPVTIAAEHGMFVKWVPPKPYLEYGVIEEEDEEEDDDDEDEEKVGGGVGGKGEKEGSKKDSPPHGRVAASKDSSLLLDEDVMLEEKEEEEKEEKEEEEEEEEWEQQVSRYMVDVSWFDDVLKILDYFTERTPGSVIEIKTTCVTWHYRDSDLGHGAWQAKQCIVSLMEFAKTSKKIEVIYIYVVMRTF